MLTVQVSLSERSYEIQIGQKILTGLPERLSATLGKCTHAIIIADQKLIVSDHAHNPSPCQALFQAFSQAGFRTSLLTVPSGEESKSIVQADRLWQALLSERADRGSAIIALGGGVIGDLAGFVAATFARGLPLVQVPTTLLSQVDSSVGGKTGINLPTAKNMVGAFWQPSLVVIDTLTLETLPSREFVSGLAEVVKYGIILKPRLFRFLEENVQRILKMDPETVMHIVAESCRAKAEVVAGDERETSGLRAILNYGHTFAHAIEAVSGYGSYLHGEAVAIGMHLAATCAARMGRVDSYFVERQKALLQQFELPVRCHGLDGQQLWDAMQHDKKVQHGSLRFVLPDRMGHVELVADVPRSLVLEVLQQEAVE